jgi:hypothetical protein
MIKLANAQMDKFDKIVKNSNQSTDALIDYWKDFALYTSLEYWMMVAILLVPLLILFFKIDKNKIFLVGFFGYSIHVIFAYVDSYGKHSGLWNYPFPIIPALPGLAIDSSLVPVTFMLVYQWTLNNKKNYYVYSIITAVIFSFIIKPLLVELGLFRMYGNINYLHLFIAYLFVLLTAKFITNVFLWTQKKYITST